MINSHRITGAFLALCLAASLCGCGGGGGGDTSTSVSSTPASPSGTGSTGTPAPAPTLSLSQSGPAGLTFTLAENSANIAVGGAVNYTLTITNPTASPVQLSAALGGSNPAPDASLMVVNSAGTTVYPIGQPRLTPPPPPVDNTVTLQPGQSLQELVVVSTFAAAGTYEATATFHVTTSTSQPTQDVRVSGLAVTAK